MTSMILAKAVPGEDVDALCARITERTGLAAFPTDAYREKTLSYWVRETGIPINFGTSIILGFVVGVAVAGQMFYNFTLDNLKYFGAMKAMGATTPRLLGMVSLQAATVAVLGFGLGIGITSAFGLTVPGDRLAFRMTWHIPLVAAGAVTLICVASAALGMYRVFRLDPADVFKG
jgi:putative ABC transport system permease protein